MGPSLRFRFWAETVCASLGSVLLALTLVSRAWIEVVFRADPDHGSGGLEWAVAAILLAIAVTSASLARREWRRPQPSTAQPSTAGS